MSLNVGRSRDIEQDGLLRSINEVVKYLELKRKNAKNWTDLATDNIENQRVRLYVLAERLIFLAPLKFGKNCVEIIWKNCFHEVLTTFRQLRKTTVVEDDSAVYLQHVINSGLGFYYYLLMKLEDTFKINLHQYISIPAFEISCGLPKADENESIPWNILCLMDPTTQLFSKESLQWAIDTAHKCFTCIGDLHRYMLDLCPAWDLDIATNNYWQALFLKPNNGFPLNQLGSLALYYDNSVDAAYYYMRSSCSEVPFAEADKNLEHLFNKFDWYEPTLADKTRVNEALICLMMKLASAWFFQKKPLKDSFQFGFHFLEAVHNDYTGVYKDLHKCQNYTLLPNTLSSFVSRKEKPVPYALYPDSHFKILLICLLSHYKIVKNNAMDFLTASITVISALLMHLSESLISKLKSDLPVPIIPTYSEYGFQQFRRRKRGLCVPQLGGHDDSSEEELVFDQISDTDSHWFPISVSDTRKHGILSEAEHNVLKVLDNNYNTVRALKVGCDWIQCYPTALIHADCWLSFTDNMVYLLNYLYPIYQRHNLSEIKQKKFIAVSEDLHLRGFLSFKSVHDNINWDFAVIKPRSRLDQMLTRIENFWLFGEFLSQQNRSRVLYDSQTKWFSIAPGRGATPQIVDINSPSMMDRTKIVEKNAPSTMDRSKLQETMAKLWLEDEARNLELRIKELDETPILPPYLVVDSDVVLKMFGLLKKLVSSKKFIVIIPLVVLDELDDIKRHSLNSREVTRWLQAELQRGNAHVKLQRKEESLTIPNLVCPMRKQKAAWTFVKLLECCYYFSRRSVGDYSSGLIVLNGSDFVRLLTGSKELMCMYRERPLRNDNASQMVRKDFGPIGSAISHSKPRTNEPFHVAVAAEIAGVKMEFLLDFYNQWKHIIWSKNYLI